jgi:hypothetical protein
MAHSDSVGRQIVEHEEATTTYAAERYVLGELSPEERELFEQHYFDCALCAEDVRDLVCVTDGARRMLVEEKRAAEPVRPPAENGSSFWARLGQYWQRPAYALAGAAAALGLTFTTGYQVAAGRYEVQPQAVASIVLRPESRGESTLIQPSQIGPFVLLEADAPAGVPLQWEIRRAGETSVLFHGDVQPLAEGTSLKLTFSASQLAPAEYILSLRDSQSAAPAPVTYRFRVGSR